jgi:hypothetical protein
VHRIELLTVNTDNGSLVISREGERGYDLSGNTLVKLSLQDLGKPYVENSYEVDQLVVSEMDLGHPGAWNKGKKQVFKLAIVKGLKPVEFRAHIRFDYVLRHAYSGADTYREDDDIVQFYNRCIEQDVTVLPAWQTALQVWGAETDDKARLEIGADEGLRDLGFSDIDTAQNSYFGCNQHTRTVSRDISFGWRRRATRWTRSHSTVTVRRLYVRYPCIRPVTC